MPNLLSNSLSGLLSQQRAIGTVSHNIANAQTPGYTRQRVEFGTREPQNLGFGSIGNGVAIQDVQRIYDQFVISEIRSSTSAMNQMDTFHSLASQVDNILSSSGNGVNVALSAFFSSLQELADDPSSLAARQVVLSEADSLIARFNSIDQQFDTLQDDVSNRITSNVSSINGLAQNIASLNASIQNNIGNGITPNDLLDRRDAAIEELSKLVTVTTVPQDDGALNIFVGGGESIVTGSQSYDLSAIRNDFNPFKVSVAIEHGTGSKIIDDRISGGTLGGTLAFRDDILDEARFTLGRVVYGLSVSFNEQHREGTDLTGALGGDFFGVPVPDALPSTRNNSAVGATVTLTDVSELEATDYRMRFVGGTWNIYDKDGSAQTYTGTGTVGDPFLFNGLSITVSGTPVAEDELLVRATSGALENVTRLINNPASIAAAAPTRAGANTANTGSGEISNGEIIDVNNPSLLASSNITFLTASTYQINGSGSFTYTAGSAIDINGTRVVINGAPAAGDQFYIEPNTGGLGDNRNALELAGLETKKLLDSSTTNLQSSALEILGQVAVLTRNAEINRDSQQIILDQNVSRRESISGVNLDEEAANLLRHQQAYTAAAQAVGIAREMLDTLFAATR